MLSTKIFWPCILILLALLPCCVHVPLSSEITEQDTLKKVLPLNQGDVIVVDGKNAVRGPSSLKDYVTAGCTAFFHNDAVGEVIKTLLMINPQPGKFAVRPLNEEGGGERERLRYKIYIKEEFEVKTRLPLYAPPFGVASCSNRTRLEAGIWELPEERFLGSYTVIAEGEYTVAAYMFHVITFRDTQKDAIVKLAGEIVRRLTGLEPLDYKAQGGL